MKFLSQLTLTVIFFLAAKNSCSQNVASCEAFMSDLRAIEIQAANKQTSTRIVGRAESDTFYELTLQPHEGKSWKMKLIKTRQSKELFDYIHKNDIISKPKGFAIISIYRPGDGEEMVLKKFTTFCRY